MEREWRINGSARANERYSNFCMENGDDDEDDAGLFVDRVLYDRDSNGGVGTSATLLPVSFSSSSSSSPLPRSSIEHPVCKFDTLAGVAIKYGVEVADVKKMNGLVTDRQMFALKSLQIPLPGRHPPSPGLLSEGQSHCGSRLMHDDRKWKTSEPEPSAAMTSLQGYYNLKPVGLKPNPRTSTSHPDDVCFTDGSLKRHSSPMAKSPLGLRRKSRSLANCLLDENRRPFEASRSGEKLVRRRQKSEADFIAPVTGKALAHRPKAAATGHYDNNNNTSSFPGNGFSGGVKKSSSTSDLLDTADGVGTSLWYASKLKIKSSNLQAVLGAGTARPLCNNGLPKPVIAQQLVG